MIQIKQFSKIEDQIKWLIENKADIEAQRKSICKKADEISFVSYAIDERGEAIKADSPPPEDPNTLKVRCIINTTNLLDSHRDVHIPGIWKKSLTESKLFYLCQEHDFTFKGIITDSVEAYVRSYTWKELGFDYPGTTEALVYDCQIKKDRNLFMFEQYSKGFVRNHSIQMRYMKMFFCTNSIDYPSEKENWDKYIAQVANVADAEAVGYFWAVTEAKIIEGSAVVRGSNFATPTIEIKEDNSGADPITPEKNEPPQSTQTEKKRRFI